MFSKEGGARWDSHYCFTELHITQGCIGRGKSYPGCPHILAILCILAPTCRVSRLRSTPEQRVNSWSGDVDWLEKPAEHDIVGKGVCPLAQSPWCLVFLQGFHFLGSLSTLTDTGLGCLGVGSHLISLRPCTGAQVP